MEPAIEPVDTLLCPRPAQGIGGGDGGGRPGLGFVRAPTRWLDIAFGPLMDVILWGSLGTYVARSSSSTSLASTSYLLAGIMLFHILFQSQIAVGTGFLEETWSRNLLNVLTTPVTPATTPAP